jgi:hypothetical protein
LAQLLYPLRHFVEGVLICYVVHDKGTLCTSIVNSI